MSNFCHLSWASPSFTEFEIAAPLDPATLPGLRYLRSRRVVALVCAGGVLLSLGTASAIWRAHHRKGPRSSGAPASRAGEGSEWDAPLGAGAAGLALTALLASLLNARNLRDDRARQLANRMLRQFQENESRFKAIAHAVPDLLFVVNEDGRYMEMYGGQEDLLAGRRKALLGSTLAERLPPDVAKICQQSLRLALETHELQTIGYELETTHGTTPYEARLFELATRIQGKRCVVLVARDITERSRAEENLRMTQKLESLGILAGGIAHDFNNLLTAILGNLNLAQTHIPQESRAVPYLQRVETTVLRAAELAHQMLAYSGRGTFTVNFLDLSQVTEEMTALIEVSVSKRATLRFELVPSPPPILADATQVRQVVMNLVTNASEALGERDGTLLLATDVQELDETYLKAQLPTQPLAPGPYVTLSVSDTGCGMDAQTLNKIFDPFFTTKTPGRGLGLSAILGILRGHGAGIHITSEAGVGSTFTVLFPVAAQQAATREKAPPPTGTQQALHGTVLAVDDEPILLATLTTMLEALGLKVLQARDGLQALELQARHGAEIQLVLMDITMPRMDGNESFLTLRQRDPQLPVILSSGFTAQEVIPPPPGTRPADFIQKPYRMGELKLALQRALREPAPSADQEDRGK